MVTSRKSGSVACGGDGVAGDLPCAHDALSSGQTLAKGRDMEGMVDVCDDLRCSISVLLPVSLFLEGLKQKTRFLALEHMSTSCLFPLPDAHVLLKDSASCLTIMN